MEQLFSAKQISKKLGLNVFTVYRMALRREIPSIKIGNLRRFRENDIENYLKKAEIAVL